jgi:hypothetical protein
VIGFIFRESKRDKDGDNAGHEHGEHGGLEPQPHRLAGYLIVASFAAWNAVVLAVLAQPHQVVVMAECAVLLTLAFIFRLIANDALKALSHEPDFNAFAFRAQSPHGRVLPDCV